VCVDNYSDSLAWPRTRVVGMLSEWPTFCKCCSVGMLAIKVGRGNGLAPSVPTV